MAENDRHRYRPGIWLSPGTHLRFIRLLPQEYQPDRRSNQCHPAAPSGTEFINLNANLINKGFEFVLGGTIVSNKDFTWDAAFNISYNKGKLTNFNYAPILTGQISGNGLSGTTAEVITNNQPSTSFLCPLLGYTKGGLDSVTPPAIRRRS